MGVYIKGIDMPTNCSRCIFKAPVNDYSFDSVCKITHEECAESGRNKHCPLTEVLEPHGGLIDADVLLEAIRTDIMGGLNYESFIREASTVIERSE